MHLSACPTACLEVIGPRQGNLINHLVSFCVIACFSKLTSKALRVSPHAYDDAPRGRDPNSGLRAVYRRKSIISQYRVLSFDTRLVLQCDMGVTLRPLENSIHSRGVQKCGWTRVSCTCIKRNGIGSRIKTDIYQDRRSTYYYQSDAQSSECRFRLEILTSS